MAGHGTVEPRYGPPVYLDPSADNAHRFFELGIQGFVTMLNLLRFREEADYFAFPGLAPPEPISGSAACDRYVNRKPDRRDGQPQMQPRVAQRRLASRPDDRDRRSGRRVFTESSCE